MNLIFYTKQNTRKIKKKEMINSKGRKKKQPQQQKIICILIEPCLI